MGAIHEDETYSALLFWSKKRVKVGSFRFCLRYAKFDSALRKPSLWLRDRWNGVIIGSLLGLFYPYPECDFCSRGSQEPITETTKETRMVIHCWIWKSLSSYMVPSCTLMLGESSTVYSPNFLLADSIEIASKGTRLGLTWSLAQIWHKDTKGSLFPALLLEETVSFKGCTTRAPDRKSPSWSSPQ